MPDMMWAANVLRPLLRFVLLKNSLSVSVPFPCLHLSLVLPFMVTQKSGGESRDLIFFKICVCTGLGVCSCSWLQLLSAMET